MDILFGTWEWYIAGPIIGLTVPLLLLLGNKLFGVSSSFRHLCSMALPKKKIEFLQYNWREHIWNLFFVGGIALGGYIAANYLSTGELTLLPAHYSTPLGIAQLFAGGILVGFGTRYAGGCTSGHAISGLATLQKPSVVAVLSFFTGGVVTVFVINTVLG
ncbi:MAG: hypothetical protein CL946_06485 [Ectothiorhodospiraceae bacterium]|nr:hypothetical protein [Ectothiorhodospiraceae bacterium]